MAKKVGKKPVGKSSSGKSKSQSLSHAARARPVTKKPTKQPSKRVASPAQPAKAPTPKASPAKIPAPKSSTAKSPEAKPSAIKPMAIKPLAGKSPAAKKPGSEASPAQASPGQASAKKTSPGKASAGKSASVGLGASRLGKAPRLKLIKPVRPELPPVRLPPPPVTSDSKMAKNRAGLTSRELEHFRDLLLEKRRELLGDVTSMEREALRSGNTNLSNLPLHMADTGTDNYEQEFTLGLVEKDRQLLREINASLAKIQDGSYGVCEGTGKPISKHRLEVQPWARHSIEYARQMEKPMYRRAY